MSEGGYPAALDRADLAAPTLRLPAVAPTSACRPFIPRRESRRWVDWSRRRPAEAVDRAGNIANGNSRVPRRTGGPGQFQSLR